MKTYNIIFKGCFIEQVQARSKIEAISKVTGRTVNPGYSATIVKIA
jgi:hypothetical protein